MPLFYPDNLEHNNPNNPLMDVNQLKGQYNINLLSERDSIPLNKRSLTQSVGCRETERIYIYIGSTVNDIDWVNPSNWKSSASDAGGSYLPLSGGTLTGPLSATTISASTYYGVTSSNVTNLSNLTGNTVTEVFNYLPKYTKSDTAPANPRVDDVWLDTNENRVPIEYIWFTDSNDDSSWVNWGSIGVSNSGVFTGSTGTTITTEYYVSTLQEFKSIVNDPITDGGSIIINVVDENSFIFGGTVNVYAKDIIVRNLNPVFIASDLIEFVGLGTTQSRIYIDGILIFGDIVNTITLTYSFLYIKYIEIGVTPTSFSLDGGGLVYNDSSVASYFTNTSQNDIWFVKPDIVSTAHTHTISDIINLQSSLDSKLSLSGGTLTGSLSGSSISATTFYGNGSNITGIDHNTVTTNKQGGQSNQYYHLTQAEYGLVSGNSLNLKSTKITFDDTPWVSTATTFTLSPIKRYDFGGSACTTSVVWTLSPMIDITEDCEYWFKITIGAGGTTHTFNGCTFGINNDPVVAGATYEFHIKKTIVFIRRII